MENEGSCVKLSLKTCPICKTHVFNDMGTCYNCMYTFGSNPELERRIDEKSVRHRQDAKNAGIMNAQPSEDRSDSDSELFEDDVLLQYPISFFETPEDCIREYETMLVYKEKEVMRYGTSPEKSDLFGEFLVEVESFLRKFLLDRKIGVQ